VVGRFTGLTFQYRHYEPYVSAVTQFRKTSARQTMSSSLLITVSAWASPEHAPEHAG